MLILLIRVELSCCIHDKLLVSQVSVVGPYKDGGQRMKNGKVCAILKNSPFEYMY